MNRNNEWISIGYPVFVRNRQGSIYEFTPEGTSFRLQLLADDQEAALEIAAKKRYPSIKEIFINLIPLQSLTCKTSFSINGKSFEVQGEALNLDHYTTVVEMPMVEHSETRRAFEARLKSKTHLRWKCKFTAAGEQQFKNRIQIEGEDIQDAAIDHDLFGPSSEVYVTRRQLTLFSQKIRTNLQIEEDYELDEKFDEKLVERLISIATTPFEHLQVDHILNKLSTFGFSMDKRDLTPNEIKRQLSDTMFMLKKGNRNSISVKNDAKQMSDREQESTDKGNGQLSVFEVFGADVAVDMAKKNRERWENSKLSANDQLEELNRENQDHVKWEIEGSTILPKTVKVALLHKSSFNRNISISYKKSVWRNAQYRKEISLTTETFGNGTFQDTTHGMINQFRQLNATAQILNTIFELRIERLDAAIERNRKSLQTVSNKKSSLFTGRHCQTLDDMYVDYDPCSTCGKVVYSDFINCDRLGEDYFIQKIRLVISRTYRLSFVTRFLFDMIHGSVENA
uniref:Uncharacterized protein n=1 Tax=Romanomermis culicivorax TaxID=13658 RepID=A0A915JU49_ROMCU